MAIVRQGIMGYYGQYMTVKSLLVWENIEEEDLTALEIPLKGEGQKISFQKQFETYYKDCPLRNQDLEWAETTFFIIFDENRILLEKIKKYREDIKVLTNPDNWQATTLLYSLNLGKLSSDASTNQGGFATVESKSKDGGKDTTFIDNNAYVATNTANSDNNSQYEKLEDYEEVVNKQPVETVNGETKEDETVKSKIPKNPLELTILANQLSQNRTLNIGEKELTLKKGTSNEINTSTISSTSSISVVNTERENAMVGKNVVTSKANETITYIKAEIPKLRTMFIAKFTPMFMI